MHIISMQSSGADITLSGPGSGLTRQRMSDHVQFRPDFKNDNYMNNLFLETA